MTEKRYFLHKHLIKNDVIHDKICHRWLKGEELEEHMNVQYTKYSALKKENEQLKKDNKEYIRGLDLSKATSQSWASDVRKLREQNEQLRCRIQYLETKLQRERKSTTQQHLKWDKQANERIQTLEKGNEQLKQQLKGYINAFDCSNCRYHNYDWFDDGDEFEVCDKGNNEEQMDNHSCKDWEEL